MKKNHNLVHIAISKLLFSSKKVKIPAFGTGQQNVETDTKTQSYIVMLQYKI